MHVENKYILANNIFGKKTKSHSTSYIYDVNYLDANVVVVVLLLTKW